VNSSSQKETNLRRKGKTETKAGISFNAEFPVGLILLAAGESKRFGGLPKQLLKIQGKSLLRHATETALKSSAETVCVVLGANAEKIKPEIENLPVRICINEKRSGGLSSSLKKGLKKLLETDPSLAAVCVMLADQPRVNAKNLSNLINIFQTEKPLIVASEYAGTVGVPAIFSRDLFGEIFALKSSNGAKMLILKRLASVRKTPLPEAAFDIDTPADYEKLLEIFKQENVMDY
jgi:molybdenum cofactor cytidylyltransferase